MLVEVSLISFFASNAALLSFIILSILTLTTLVFFLFVFLEHNTHQSTWMVANLKIQRKMPFERAKVVSLPLAAETKSDWNPRSRPPARWTQARSTTRTHNSFSSRTMPTYRSMAIYQIKVKLPASEWVALPKWQAPLKPTTWVASPC